MICTPLVKELRPITVRLLCLWYYIGKGELGLLSLDHYLYRPWLFVQALAICTIVRAIPAARRNRPYAMLWLRSLSQSRRRYGVCFSLSHNLQHRLRALRALASRVFSHPPHPCFLLGLHSSGPAPLDPWRGAYLIFSFPARRLVSARRRFISRVSRNCLRGK